LVNVVLHAAPQMMKTNIEHPTSNVEDRTTLALLGHSMFDVRCSMFGFDAKASPNRTPHSQAS